MGNDGTPKEYHDADLDFNPRSRVGNDPKNTVIADMVIISIHVPAWGTTTFQPCLQKKKIISIHVPAWGTTLLVTATSVIAEFQSTFPRGERRSKDASVPDF